MNTKKRKEVIEKFSLKPIGRRFQSGQNLEWDEVALDCRIQKIVEGMKGLVSTRSKKDNIRVHKT